VFRLPIDPLYMATTSDIARLFNVSGQTIRVWCKEFALYLSPGATPPDGETRSFTEDDVAVFALAARMRQEAQATYEQIRQALAEGERGHPPREDPSMEYPPAPVLWGQLQAARGELKAVEDRIGDLKEDRELLRRELAAEREARLRALERAAQAEAEVRVLREQQERKDAGQAFAGENPPEKPKSWLDRLLGR
jgi:DNA-binding transcriptional MerR regulator